MNVTYRLQWLRTLFLGRYQQVAIEYAGLGAKKNLLADIATRGGVFDPVLMSADPLSLAFQEGRRSLALEILQLARADPFEVEAFVKTAIRTQPEKEPRHG